MDVVLSFQSLLIGVTLGLLGYDWHLRRQAQKAVAEHKAELASTLKTVVEAHNNLTSQVKLINDKLQAHEFRLTQPAMNKGFKAPSMPG